MGDPRGKTKVFGDRSLKVEAMEVEGESGDGFEEEDGFGMTKSRKKGLAIGGSPDGLRRGSGDGGGTRSCQADDCTADLRDAKQYHRRHKVCEHHAKAQAVVVAGVRQRFCQQCSRFHELSEFDENKRSCRTRLAGHNERRRKNSGESHAEGPSRKGHAEGLKNLAAYGEVDEKGRINIAVQEDAAFKRFQIT